MPWETMQDEIGVQVSDCIASVALLLVRAAQFERRPESTEDKGDLG